MAITRGLAWGAVVVSLGTAAATGVLGRFARWQPMEPGDAWVLFPILVLTGLLSLETLLGVVNRWLDQPTTREADPATAPGPEGDVKRHRTDPFTPEGVMRGVAAWSRDFGDEIRIGLSETMTEREAARATRVLAIRRMTGPRRCDGSLETFTMEEIDGLAAGQATGRGR